MKALPRFKTVFKTLSVAAMMIAAIAFAGERPVHGQSLTINFRFDGQTGAAATTQTIQPGTAGQNFTVDVWATIVGPAGTTGAQAGLVTLRFRGLSSTTADTAFATAAGIGVTSFTMLSPFNSTANIPTLGDVGSATNYATTSTTLDGIADFGGTAQTSAAVANSNAGTTPELGGTASATGQPVTNGWDFMIGQFTFKTGTASATAGATTSFLPVTGLGASASKSSYTVDGGTTFLHGDWTSGSAINFVVAGTVTGNDSILNMAPAAVPTINSLAGGTNTTNLTVTNTAADAATATGAFTTSLSGTNAAGASVGTITNNPVGTTPATVPVSFAASGTPSTTLATFSLAISNTSNAGDSQAAGNKTSTFTVNVGEAVADGQGLGPASSTTFANATLLTGVVAHGGSYAGLQSVVASVNGTGGSDARNVTNPALGGTAIIRAGTNTLANGGVNPTTVGMQWRTLSSLAAFNEQTGKTPTGNIYSANLRKPTTGLVSDVMNLTGLTAGTEAAGGATDPFVLEMSYNPALLPKGNPTTGAFSPLEATLAGNGLITLVSYNSTTGLWDRATDDNIGGPGTVLPAGGFFVGSYSAFLAANPSSTPTTSLGTWGVDPTNHVVWADINHNSQFAVVPEPSTLLLAGLGLFGLVALRRRVTKSA